MEFRVGQGLDTHRLIAGRKLMLGGVEIPFHLGLLGHSDADVLIHAIVDALLGAAGESDIGSQFPDTDARWKDASSVALLKDTWEKIRGQGWKLINIDSTIVAEAPKLAPYIPAMKSVLAEALGSDPRRVGIKAGTNEGLGPVGAGEAMQAFAVALLARE